jgi:hypothetical protein
MNGPAADLPWAFYDPADHALKNAQLTLLAGDDDGHVDLPSAGTLTAGQVRERPAPAVPDDVPLLRTPQAALTEPKPDGIKLVGRSPSDPQVGLADQIKALLLPSPTSRDYKDTGDLTGTIAKYPNGMYLPRRIFQIENAGGAA